MQSRLRFAAHLLFAVTLASVATPQSRDGPVPATHRAPLSGITVLLTNGGGSGSTDAVGNFTITGLRNRNYTVDFYSPTFNYAGAEFSVNVSGATNMGTVVMEPGVQVSGIVVGPPGHNPAGGNMNVYDNNGTKRFTPNDAIAANGSFSITVPLGYNQIRALPPATSGLMPYDWLERDVQAPLNFGTVTMEVGYPVTATVVDAVSGVPILGVRVTTFNQLTGQEYAQVSPVTNVFGAVTLSLPSLKVIDLELVPSTVDAHMPKQMFGTITVPGPTALGQIRLDRALLLNGTVNGPFGGVSNADIDVYTADNHKLYTPKDNSVVGGGYFVKVPGAGSYRFTAQPLVATGLTGGDTGYVTISGSGLVPTINVTQGSLVSGTVTGPTGLIANANINVFDSVTGNRMVVAGDHTNAAGAYGIVLPNGTYNFVADAPNGNAGAPQAVNGVVVAGAMTQDFTLAPKDLITNTTSFATLTVAPGGFLPVNIFIHNTTQNFLGTQVEIVVQYPSGAETPVFPPLPIDVAPQFPLLLGPIFMPVPPIPANQLDKPIRYCVRFRSQATLQIIDSAYAVFIAH